MNHEIIEHTTRREKVLRGVIVRGIDAATAKTIDEYTFIKDGGWFIREKHLQNISQLGVVADSGATTPKQQAEVVKREDTKSIAAKMHALADGLRDKANAELKRDRLANTSRRARMADNAIARAEADVRLADTLANIADAIDSDTAYTLKNVRSIANVRMLEQALSNAAYKRASASNDRSEGHHAVIKEGDHRYAELPRISWGAGASAIATSMALKGVRGAKELRENIQYSSEPTPEIKAGLIKFLGEEKARSLIGWHAFEVMADLKRFAALGIKNNSDLAGALAEYYRMRGAGVKADPVRAAERALVGQKLGVDFFPTPKPIAERMAELAGVADGMRVLEPSAGNGHLADAAAAAGATVDTYEISDSLRNILRLKGHNVVGHDFEQAGQGCGEYDAVIMNPPFSNRLDAAHIQQAWGFVKGGGTLVAIAGEGLFFGSDKKAEAFRDWLDAHDAEVEKLPEGTFQDKTLLVTTGVNARLIVMHKQDGETA